MLINQIFELSMVLDTDKFQELITQSYTGDECLDENEWVDESLSSKGMTVFYRASQYKKKVRLIVDAAVITEGDASNTEKLIRKLKKRVDQYFDSFYQLEDFSLSGLSLITSIDVGSRQNVLDYLQVIRRIGRVKGFSPICFDRLDDKAGFCLRGNSNGIDFLLYDLEQLNKQEFGKYDGKGTLRAEVRLMKQKAIQKYTIEYDVSSQIVDLAKRAQSIFMEIFTRIIPFGAFYKKSKAAELVITEVKERVLRRRMLRLLTLIPEKKSLLLAQKAMAYRHPNDLLIEFAKINLSPVTISKRQEVKSLRNIYDYLV